MVAIQSLNGNLKRLNGLSGIVKNYSKAKKKYEVQVFAQDKKKKHLKNKEMVHLKTEFLIHSTEMEDYILQLDSMFEFHGHQPDFKIKGNFISKAQRDAIFTKNVQYSQIVLR